MLLRTNFRGTKNFLHPTVQQESFMHTSLVLDMMLNCRGFVGLQGRAMGPIFCWFGGSVPNQQVECKIHTRFLLDMTLNCRGFVG